MARSKTEILDELWMLTAEHIIDKIKSGKAMPSDIANASKFLKEGITSELKDNDSNDDAKDSILNEIGNLPFDVDDISIN